MTAEFPRLGNEQGEYSPGRFVSCAELAMRAPATRVLSDFMWQCVGAANVLERHRQGVPVYSRSTEAGRDISYREVLASGFTDLGCLVHVRVNRQEDDLKNRYLIVVGDLKGGVLYEDEVVAEHHEHSVRDGLVTTLYLQDVRDGSWNQEYLPQVIMTQRGMFYTPGYENRLEQLQDPAILIDACMALPQAGWLRVVPDVSQ